MFKNFNKMKNLFVFIFITFIVSQLNSQNNHRYIVKFKSPQESSKFLKKVYSRSEIETRIVFDEMNIFSIIVKNPEQDDISNLVKNSSGIEYLTEDFELQYRSTPDDPFYNKQYGPSITKANEVWDYNTGGISGTNDTIVIAVLDQGVYNKHDDLIENIWRNHGEIPDDKIDNDNNGYIDDYRGVDMETKNGTLNSHYHGTGVAGIIGAKGNNKIGICGINWNVKILPITSIRYVSDVIAGYNYVYKLRKAYNDSNGSQGSFIVSTNLSAGYDNKFPSDNQSFIDWCNIYNLLGTVGILSVTAASNSEINVETEGDMPTLCTSNYLIPVNSTDSNDNFDDTKSYGKSSIDIAAPGKTIYTLSTDNGYRAEFTGNSAAAPHVAGAIGLLYTIPCKGFTDIIKANPAELSLKIKDFLMTYSDKLTDLKDKNVSGGRLNIFSTYLHLAELCGELPTGDFSIMNIFPNPAYDKVRIEYNVENYDTHTLLINDASGKLIFKSEFKPAIFSEKVLEIDVSHYPDGVYYARIISGKEIRVKSFEVLTN